MRWMMSWCSVFALAATACNAGSEPVDRPWNPDEIWAAPQAPENNPEPDTVVLDSPPAASRPVVEPVVEPPRPAGIGQCPLELAWAKDDTVHRIQPAFFGFSPDSKLLFSGDDAFGSGWGALRGRDGEVFVHTRHDQAILDVSADGQRMLVHRRQEHESVLHVVSGLDDEAQVHWSSPKGFAIGAMHESSHRVAAISCPRELDASAQLLVWDSSSSAVLHSVGLGPGHCHWFEPLHRLRFLPDGQRLITWRMAQTRPQSQPAAVVMLVDLRDSSVTDIALPIDHEDSWYAGTIAGLELRPDGHTLDVVDHGGTRYLVDLEEDHPKAEAIGTRGAFAANHDTYLPRLPNSPMVFDAQAQLEISVTPEGLVEILDLRDRSQLALLETPFADDELLTSSGVTNAPVSIALTPDRRGLAVAYRQGVVLWQCQGRQLHPDSVEAHTPDAFTIRAPERAVRGQEIDITLEAETSPGTVRKLWIDGVLRQTSWTNTLSWTPYPEGRREIVVELDNGWEARRSEALFLDVRLPPRR